MNATLRERRRRLEAARARFESEHAADTVDGSVAASWSRSAVAVPADMRKAPVDGTIPDSWDASPIRRFAGDVVEQLSAVAEAEDYVAAITDGRGQIIWSRGGPAMTKLAERVNFVAGARWDEGSVGTNAPGRALVTGRPETVFSVEHWSEAVRDWVCYAAPVRGPDARIIGVLDLSSTWSRATPLAGTTIAAMARLVEQLMPAGTGPSLDLRFLGAPEVVVDGRVVHLPLRQLEILAVLVGRGQVTLDELQYHLYGDRPVGPSTLKAEISHLRRALGGRIASRPYQLTAPVDADLAAVLDAIRDGRPMSAIASYRGQLLPASEAPLITELRHHIDVVVRTALLRTGSPADLLQFAEVHPYDVEVLLRAEALLDGDDPYLASVRARLAAAGRDA